MTLHGLFLQIEPMQDEVLELEFQGWKKKFTMLQVYLVDIAGSLYQRGSFLLG
jgi:hypothetical protein